MSKDKSLPLRRGCEIEVCTEEDGLEGAWFKAILKDCPRKSARKKLSVRYESLQADDGSPLCEAIYRRFMRPVPPENLFSAADFEEGSVVEAAHRDGWWTCVFVKKMDDDKHLVYFDSPPDLILFRRRQLRLHFDWTIEGGWVRPQNRRSSNRSTLRCGTMVEVEVTERRNDVVWVPSVIVKEMNGGKSFIVKSCKYMSWNDEIKPNRNVSSRNIRPSPPPFPVENYELMEDVEVFIDPGWRPGIVKNILCDKHYTVCLKATNDSLVFQHSDLRPSKESISKRSMRDSIEVNAAITPQRSLSAIEIVATSESSSAQGSGTEMADDVINEAGTSDVTATPMKQTKDKAQGRTSHERTLEPMQNQIGSGNESTREKMFGEHNNEDDSRKRKRGELEHNTDLSETVNEPVSPLTPSRAIASNQAEAETQEKTFSKKSVQPVRNQNGLGNDSTREDESLEESSPKRRREENLSSTGDGEETEANGREVDLPFAKQSPFWKTCEAMELFQRVPQSPHFNPLAEVREHFREGFAFGMMLTFSGLLEELKDLETDVPMSQLGSLQDSFAELEKHGFDVKAPQSRISKLLSLKDEQTKKMEELNGFEKKIAEEESRKVEMEQKILELQGLKEEADKEIAQMKSCAKAIGQQLEDVELRFQTTVSAPL